METIGDAYMVVGGLPEPNKTHAADVCNQAIDMMMCAQKVTDPTNPDKSIKVFLYTLTCVRFGSYVCVRVCVFMHVYVCTCMYALTPVYVCLYVHTRVSM